jgi:hypothetical protein
MDVPHSDDGFNALYDSNQQVSQLPGTAPGYQICRVPPMLKDEQWCNMELLLEANDGNLSFELRTDRNLQKDIYTYCSRGYTVEFVEAVVNNKGGCWASTVKKKAEKFQKEYHLEVLWNFKHGEALARLQTTEGFMIPQSGDPDSMVQWQEQIRTCLEHGLNVPFIEKTSMEQWQIQNKASPPKWTTQWRDIATRIQWDFYHDSIVTKLSQGKSHEKISDELFVQKGVRLS